MKTKERKNVPTYFNMSDDLESKLYDHLSRQLSKGKYIKYLIQKDMGSISYEPVVNKRPPKESINIDNEIDDLEI